MVSKTLSSNDEYSASYSTTKDQQNYIVFYSINNCTTSLWIYIARTPAEFLTSWSLSDSKFGDMFGWLCGESRRVWWERRRYVRYWAEPIWSAVSTKSPTDSIALMHDISTLIIRQVTTFFPCDKVQVVICLRS